MRIQDIIEGKREWQADRVKGTVLLTHFRKNESEEPSPRPRQELKK